MMDMVWMVILCLVMLATGIYAISKNFLTFRAEEEISLEGLHVMITGGSKGLGRALALEAVVRGANVSIVARNPVSLDDARHQLEEIADRNAIQHCRGQRVVCISADVTDEEQVEEAWQKAEKALGEVDVLVNNAGAASQTPFHLLPNSVFRDQMRLNFLGSVYLTKLVVPRMRERRFGRIVFVSSQAGQLGLYGYTAYSASKFALRGFAEALQMELAPFNVRTTLVFPPNTNTEGFHRELLEMPKPTKVISESSGLWEPSVVAKKAWGDVCAGDHWSVVGLEGWYLGLLSCGMAPESKPSTVLQEVFLMGFFRLIGLGYLRYCDSIVRKYS